MWGCVLTSKSAQEIIQSFFFEKAFQVVCGLNLPVPVETPDATAPLRLQWRKATSIEECTHPPLETILTTIVFAVNADYT